MNPKKYENTRLRFGIYQSTQYTSLKTFSCFVLFVCSSINKIQLYKDGFMSHYYAKRYMWNLLYRRLLYSIMLNWATMIWLLFLQFSSPCSYMFRIRITKEWKLKVTGCQPLKERLGSCRKRLSEIEIFYFFHQNEDGQAPCPPFHRKWIDELIYLLNLSGLRAWTRSFHLDKAVL